jgi:putative N6-adenine-specific DNA methylase
VKSPLNEATAAGLLMLAGWSGRGVLADPMCGSGTFLVEAALLARDEAPGLHRRFAFERWPDFDRRAWAALREEATARIVPAPAVTLLGADHHGGALSIARRTLREAGLAELVRLEQADVARWEPPALPDTVVVNPPWGERLGEGEDLRATWGALGTFLKRRCPGADAWVLCGEPSLSRELRMKASRRIPVATGPVDCRWLHYEVGPLREPAPREG